ncbi:MAG: MFS transporter [Legionella sp.]|uniref:MFS transporter n=1 Tax=Legionella sp. TaxID=459 RepID=UPI00284A5235|nr:MFS transporter [Legionella sp.]
MKSSIRLFFKKFFPSNVPFIMLLFISISSSMLPTLLGAIFLHQSGFLSDVTQNTKLNIYGLTLGAYFIGSTVGGLICGYLADRYGEKKILFFFFLGAIIATSLGIYSLITINLSLFILSKTLEGFTLGRVAIMSLLSHIKESKTEIFRKTEIMNAGGLFVGPVICGFLINFTGTVPLYYYATPLFLILAMKIMNFLLVGPLEAAANESEKEESSAGGTTYNHPVFKEFFLYQLAWYFYFLTIVPFAMVKLGFNSYQIGVLFSSMVVFYMLALNLTNKLPSATLESLAMKKLSVCTIIASLLYVAYFGNYLSFILGNVCIIFAASVLMPVYLSTMSKLASEINHGVTMGVQSSIMGISTATAALLSGPLMGLSINLPFYIGALLMLILYYFFCYQNAPELEKLPQEQ